MNTDFLPPTQAGNRVIADHAKREVRTFFDEIKNGTRTYRTVASLDAQVAQEYRGRCVLELLQNAHDALAEAEPNDPRRISFVLNTSPEPVLLIGNTGAPFRRADFEGICQLAQSLMRQPTETDIAATSYCPIFEISIERGSSPVGRVAGDAKSPSYKSNSMEPSTWRNGPTPSC